MKKAFEMFQKLNSPQMFEILASLDEERLKVVYGEMHTLGYQLNSTTGLDRILNAIVFELNARENLRTKLENQKSFVLMKRLTYLAIGIAAFQAILQIVDYFGRS